VDSGHRRAPRRDRRKARPADRQDPEPLRDLAGADREAGERLDQARHRAAAGHV